MAELTEIVRRRFGRDHALKCERPEIITCAQWDCQVANVCRHHPRWWETAYAVPRNPLEKEKAE